MTKLYEQSAGYIEFGSERRAGDVRIPNYIYDLWLPLLGADAIMVYSIYCRLEREGRVYGMTTLEIARSCRIGKTKLQEINAILVDCGFIRLTTPKSIDRLRHYTNSVIVLDPPRKISAAQIEKYAPEYGYQPLTKWLVQRIEVEPEAAQPPEAIENLPVEDGQKEASLVPNGTSCLVPDRTSLVPNGTSCLVPDGTPVIASLLIAKKEEEIALRAPVSDFEKQKRDPASDMFNSTVRKQAEPWQTFLEEVKFNPSNSEEDASMRKLCWIMADAIGMLGADHLPTDKLIGANPNSKKARQERDGWKIIGNIVMLFRASNMDAFSETAATIIRDGVKDHLGLLPGSSKQPGNWSNPGSFSTSIRNHILKYQRTVNGGVEAEKPIDLNARNAMMTG